MYSDGFIFFPTKFIFHGQVITAVDKISAEYIIGLETQIRIYD